jgi:hypothetical protein
MSNEFSLAEEKALENLADILSNIGKSYKKNEVIFRAEAEWQSLGCKYLKKDLLGRFKNRKEIYASELQEKLEKLSKNLEANQVEEVVNSLPEEFEISQGKYNKFMHFIRLTRANQSKETEEDRLYRVTYGFIK